MHVMRTASGEIHRFVPVDATPGSQSTLKRISKDAHDEARRLLHDDIANVLTENGVDAGETVRSVWDMMVDKNEGFQNSRAGIDDVNRSWVSIQERRRGERE